MGKKDNNLTKTPVEASRIYDTFVGFFDFADLLSDVINTDRHLFNIRVVYGEDALLGCVDALWGIILVHLNPRAGLMNMPAP
ncbi:hypothetical protein [Zobellella sp. DQSA1]|uniref:hypothetical protein n=1 Tax=Zobellella sp. DQSA1 TaxID=3342386 RepID=UPI0035C14300